MMNQQPRPRQVSPLSMESTDSSFLTRYQMMNPSDNPYGPVSSGRNHHASPSASQHQSTSTDSRHRSPSSRSPSGSNGHISSSSSLARSSEGNGLYSPALSDSGRPMTHRTEEALVEHYHVLKQYLAPYLDKETGGRSTKAKDKLLRLSPTQFQELSTDVYDEHRRREDDRRRRGQGVPRSLPSRNDFHPKRNQARQKLSTLPPDRFRQLATDVLFELERRVPRLGGADMDRVASPAPSMASSRGPGRPPQSGMRPGPPGGARGPPSGTQRDPANDFGRPLPQTFHSNTLVPNKSTMIEDDETDDEDGLLGVVDGLTKEPSGRDSESIKAYEQQLAALQEKVASLEDRLQTKDGEIEKLEGARRERELDFGSERDGWNSSRNSIERQMADLQRSRDAFQSQMDQTHQQRSERERGLKDQLDRTVTEMQSQLDRLNGENSMLRAQGGSTSDNSWRERCEILQDELARQEKVTEEVRRDMTQFLQEMRVLSEQSEGAMEREEHLRSHIVALEAENEEWKSRYARTKTQLRTLKASSIGLPLQQMTGDSMHSRQQYLSRNGVVNDVGVTHFQISIDELLQAARQGEADLTLDKMKAVVISVQHIIADGEKVDTGLLSPMGSPDLMSPQLNGVPPSTSALKTRVTRNANGLITATRNYVSSNNLSPVSLVDAAAANLTAAVVDYLKTVGIKATPTTDLQNNMDVDDDGYEMLAPKTHVPQQLSRGIDPKANGGWFTRLKGSFDSAYSNDNIGGTMLQDEDDDDDYNSYR